MNEETLKEYTKILEEFNDRVRVLHYDEAKEYVNAEEAIPKIMDAAIYLTMSLSVIAALTKRYGDFTFTSDEISDGMLSIIGKEFDDIIVSNGESLLVKKLEG